VPFTSFAENETLPDGSRPPVWFAFDESRPLAFFAGIWATWTSVRKVKEGPVRADLFGFLTSAPNAEVGAVHPKAMPVILTEAPEWETWLTAPWAGAKALQRPLPDGSLRIVRGAGKRMRCRLSSLRVQGTLSSQDRSENCIRRIAASRIRSLCSAA
jgi:putative SOS response-associated peptidase YedK